LKHNYTNSKASLTHKSNQVHCISSTNHTRRGFRVEKYMYTKTQFYTQSLYNYDNTFFGNKTETIREIKVTEIIREIQ